MPNLTISKNASIINKILPAYTIAETITAMLILVISFGAGTMIYSQVLQGERVCQKTQINFLLNQALADILLKKNYATETFEADNIRIEKKIESFGGEKGVYKITLKALNPADDSEIMTIEQIMHIEK